MKIISVKVKPNGRVSAFTEMDRGMWLAQIKSPPVGGKANAELIELIARHFGCHKSAVSIKSGRSVRAKRVAINVAAGEGPLAEVDDRSRSQRKAK